jgi:hypothetical protein
VCGAFRVVRGYCIMVIGVGAFLAVRNNTRLLKGAVEDCGSLVRGGDPGDWTEVDQFIIQAPIANLTELEREIRKTRRHLTRLEARYPRTQTRTEGWSERAICPCRRESQSEQRELSRSFPACRRIRLSHQSEDRICS